MASHYQRTLGTHGTPLWTVPIHIAKKAAQALLHPRSSRAITPTMNTLQLRNSFLLLLTAVIWGVAFVAQSVGMDYVGPFTFNMTRFLIGAVVLLPVIWFMDHQRAADQNADGVCRINPDTDGAAKNDPADRKTVIIGGICCGIALAVASTLQQWGILFTTVGKAGFITAMYIVIVPLLGIFIGKKVRPLIIGCVAIAVVGFYFLCQGLICSKKYYKNITKVVDI